jgi:hypothetical protein
VKVVLLVIDIVSFAKRRGVYEIELERESRFEKAFLKMVTIIR